MKKQLALLEDFIVSQFPASSNTAQEIKIPDNLLRTQPANLPSFSHDELLNYYEQLAGLNVSSDDGCYPLGSCTMKYNPMLNDCYWFWMAFRAHPQAPEEDVQGPLEILYQIQQWFKASHWIGWRTTLKLQVAGAQGNLRA